MDELYIFGIFVLGVIIFGIINRKNIEIKPGIWIPIPFTKHKLPIIYMVLWHTTFGLKWLKKAVLRHKMFFRWVGSVSVFLAICAVIMTAYALIKNITDMILVPEMVTGTTVMLVLPFKTQTQMYVPIIYWLISIFVIAVVHEGGHAALAMAHRIPIKSAGLAFLCLGIPVIPAAFVQPDATVVPKKTKQQQLGFFSAGSGFNMVVGILFLGVFLLIRQYDVLWLSKLFFWLTLLNLGVGMFNVLPIFPLDGGHMVHAMVKESKKETLIVGVFSIFFLVLLASPYFL